MTNSNNQTVINQYRDEVDPESNVDINLKLRVDPNNPEPKFELQPIPSQIQMLNTNL